MASEPKKRHSRARQGKRRESIHLALKAAASCKNCGRLALPHTICKACGSYNGRIVLPVAQK